jgi:hypothetical protein
MIETKATFGDAYGIDNLFMDLKNGIFSEVKTGASISVHRRNVQKLFVEKLIAMLKPAPPASAATAGRGFGNNTPSPDLKKTDIYSLTRATLAQLQSELKKAAKGSKDGLSRYHLEDCSERIRIALKGE